jgi:hypothetical protein
VFPGKLSTNGGRAKILMDRKRAGDFLISEPCREVPHIKKAAALEGKRELAQKIIDGAAVDPSKLNSAPDTVRAVRKGKAKAGAVYYPAAVTARNDVDIVCFPAGRSFSSSDSKPPPSSPPGRASA